MLVLTTQGVQEVVDLAAHGPAEHVGVGMLMRWIVYYLVRHFFGSRKYVKSLRKLEGKMEKGADADSSISGSSNPGRSTVDLLDIMYDDVKDIKKTLTRHEGELGKIKGKLDIH